MRFCFTFTSVLSDSLVSYSAFISFAILFLENDFGFNTLFVKIKFVYTSKLSLLFHSLSSVSVCQ